MRVGTLEIQMMADMARLSKDMRQAQNVVGGAMSQVERFVAGAKRAMQALGVGLPLAMITDQVRRMTDQYTKLDAQLRLSTRSQAEYARGMADIRRISGIAQADLSATSMLYTRLLNVMKGTGVEQSKLATVTETVSFGLKAYGATAQEASSAALQLSQAMGANRLGGEEFRAVMEAMPNVMKVLADSMGVPLGELRALSIAGKITADEMVKAFGNPAIAAEFKRLAENAQTITGAWVVARNEFTLLIGEFMKSSGATNVFMGAFKAMGETFALLAKHMGSLIFIASTYAAFLATRLVVSTVLAIEKTIAHSEALAINAAMKARAAQQEAALVAAKAATASATAASTVSLLRNTVATVESNTATLAKTVADNAATVAQLNHARSVAQLSGHYYIIRQIEAELTVTTQALTVAQTELNVSTARQARLQAALIAEDKAALKARADLVKANAAVVASQNAATASAVTGIASIGVALRTATMAHPVLAATTAIIAIVAAIANWKEIVDTSKASFTWFMDEFVGGLQFLAMGVGISLGELVQKMSLLANLTWSDLKSGEFKKRWDELGALAEQSRIDAAAKLRGIDQETRDREKLEAALALAQDRAAWDKLHATEQQRRAIEISELDAMYVKLAGVHGRSQSEQLALAAEYRVKLSLINEKYSRAELKAAEKEASAKLKAAEKEASAKLKAAAKLYEEEVKMRQDYADTLSSETRSINEKTAATLLETESIGKTKAEIDLLQAARYDHETQVMRETLATYESANACTIEAEALKEAIAAREAYKKAQTDQSDVRARQKAIDDERKAHEKMWKSIDKTAHDTFVSIIDGGKDAATRLKEAFKNAFFDWLYSMTLKKWIINVSTVTAGGTSASAMAGGTGGGVGGTVGWLSAGKSVYDAINGSVSAAISNGFTQLAGSSFGQNMGWSTATTNAQGVQMQSLSDSGMAMNAGLQAIGNAATGHMLQKTISGEYKIGNGKIVDALTLAASAYFGPITGVVAGIVNRAFGMGPKQSGTTTLAGQFSGAGFAGQYQTPWSQAGGWFRSNKSGVDVSPVAAEQQAALSALVVGSKSVFDNLIAASGEAGKSLIGWTFAINRQVATEAQAQQLTIDMSDSMGRHMVPSLAAFVRQGESLADTAVRMRDVFVATDAILGVVGRTFSEVGMASMEMRANLIDLLGGIQQANTSMQAYYQAFFSSEEHAVNGWKQMTATLRQLGVDTLPTTNAEFRALVEAQDLSTRSGQEVFAALIGLAPTFDQLTKSTAALQTQTGALAADLMTLSTNSFATLVDYTRALRLSQQGEVSAVTERVAQVFANAPAAATAPATPSFATAADQAQAHVESQQRIAAKAAALKALEAVKAIPRPVELDTRIFAWRQQRLNEIAKWEADVAAAQANYDALPAFAGGGVHAGGMRLVGENGPEIEYTGPSRIVSNSEARNMLDNSGVIASVDALRAELRSLGLAISAPIQKTYKVLDRWNGEGMPEVREAA